MKRPREARDGQTYLVPAGHIVKEACCACGLAHLVKYDLAGDRIAVTAWLAGRASRLDKSKKEKQ